MKFFTCSILLTVCVLSAHIQGNAQGCVAIRNMQSCSLTGDSVARGWQLSLNYRFFRSYKHFRGDHEEKNRVEDGTEVINKDHSILLGVAYTINKHWSATITIPYLSIDRSSLYEHYGNAPGNPRFHTQSKGLGDLRLIGYYSALANNPTTRLSLGLGVKLPTGDYKYKDHFHKRDIEGGDSLVYKVVDQSIQPGDGGTGLIVEIDFSHELFHNFRGFVSGTYMFNPRNTNGIERSPNLTSGIPLSNEFSVVDQFLFRAGASYNIKGIQIGVGGRYEGIPSEDVFGDSDGFRRPGYIISIEPAVAYNTGKHSLGVNFPIALKRNRVQNTIDKIRTEQSGTYTIGDAAFADWLVSVSYSYRLSR